MTGTIKLLDGSVHEILWSTDKDMTVKSDGSILSVRHSKVKQWAQDLLLRHCAHDINTHSSYRFAKSAKCNKCGLKVPR